MIRSGRNEAGYVRYFYKRFQGRVAIGVGYSEGMIEIFPFVLENRKGRALGLVAMAVLMREDMTSVHIYHFSTFKQKRGNGSKMLAVLCQKADERNIILSLTPIPFDNGRDDQISRRKLISWYRKFGFTGNSLLCRYPEIESQ